MLASVCRLSASSVTLPVGGRAGRRARWRSGGRQCTAGQYGFVQLGLQLVVLLIGLYVSGITLDVGLHEGFCGNDVEGFVDC